MLLNWHVTPTSVCFINILLIYFKVFVFRWCGFLEKKKLSSDWGSNPRKWLLSSSALSSKWKLLNFHLFYIDYWLICFNFYYHKCLPFSFESIGSQDMEFLIKVGGWSFGLVCSSWIALWLVSIIKSVMLFHK